MFMLELSKYNYHLLFVNGRGHKMFLTSTYCLQEGRFGAIELSSSNWYFLIAFKYSFSECGRDSSLNTKWIIMLNNKKYTTDNF